MKKRLITLALLVSMLLTMLVPVPTMSSDNYSDVVLVLDSSGSMKNTAIEACKKSAIEFCTRLLSSKTKYRIALVIYESDVEKYSFTDDLNTLKSNISSMYADGGTNMHDALVAANELILSSNAASKNVVIMADGIPEHGQSQTSGRYTSYDSPHYDHANVVYTKAVSMHPSCNMYTLGFFHNIKKTDQREFAVRFLNDLQNRGYYEASNAEELYKAFLDIVEMILVPPMEIKLSHELISNYTTEGESGKRDLRSKYKVTAKITNTGSANADNVKAKINPAPGMELDKGETKEFTLGTFAPNETKTVTWYTRFEQKAEESKYQYGVVAGADNAVGVEQFDTIIVPAGNTSLLFDEKDKYTFAHTTSNFHDGYKLYSSDLELMRKNISNIDNLLISMSTTEFGGSCFGMSAVAVLSKIGTLKPHYYQDNAASISEFEKPIDNPKVESVINYYQFMQKSTVFKNSVKNLSDKEALQRIEDNLDSDSKIPSIITFNWTKNNKIGISRVGHAIIAVGYESTNESNSPSGLDLQKYTKKINIYDVNSFQKPNLNEYDIYYSDDYKHWIIPAYDKEHYWNFNFVHVTNNPNDYNSVSLDSIKEKSDNTRNQNAILTANSYTDEIILKNSTGKLSTVTATEVKGDLDIWTYYDAMVLADDNGTYYSPANIVLPSLNDDYSVSLKNSSANADLVMSYENSVLCVKSDKLDNVEFTKDGKVAVSGNEGEFELSSTYNEGHYNMPWHTVSVKGKDSNKVAIDKTDKGIVLTGDNLKDVKIEGTGKNGNKVANISTDEGAILIGANKDGDDFAFFKDKDNDGKFETDITSSVVKSEKEEGFFTKLLNSIKAFFNSIINFFKNLF